MPSVNVKEFDSFDVAARRFKRACEKAGILTRLRELDHYIKPTTRRKRRAAAAVKRHQKKLFKENEALLRTRTKHPQRRIHTADIIPAAQVPIEDTAEITTT